MKCKISLQGVYSSLYPIAPEGNQRSSYSTNYSLPQRGSSRAATRPVIHCPRGEREEKGEPEEAAIYSTSLLDPGSHRGGSRFYSIKAASEEATDRSTCPSYSILYLTPLLDQGRPTLQDLLIIQSVFGSSSFPTQSDS
ncbi:unnamed protein product [Arabidopsis thaliana]|uniref:Uncharacterized protein n=1 Tax=Arabidopsis thaliana TaxID=3702 RepID=A0A654EH82_ARATH|nr:unnamed protein product [Arabidopsis thaliana]